VYSGADIYFSAITPSATGGQPASAYFMMKDGIPGSVVTVTLLINLIMYTLALLFLGLLNVIISFHVYTGFGIISRLLIILGSGVLVFMAVLFYLLLKKPGVLKRAGHFFISILEKLHMMKGARKRRERLEKMTEEYAMCSDVMFGKGKVLLEVFFWNVMQRLSQLMVSFMVFMAMGQGLGSSLNVLSVQCFVALGSNCVPVPGAMGVADYMMLDGLRQVIAPDMIVNMELMCRGITFYGSVIAGLIIVTVGYFMQKRRG
jgi:uncharacterized membrane protein YbhN (UPF0104 family)